MKSALAAAALAVASTPGALPVAAKDSDQDWSDLKIIFVVWSEEFNPFFVPVINGAQNAAEDQGLTIEVQYGNTDLVRQSTIHETAVANEVDGIATTVWDDQAFDQVLCDAEKQGIAIRHLQHRRL